MLAVLVLLSFTAAFMSFRASSAHAEGAQAVSAKSMIVLEGATNRVLFEQNAYQKLPMASTTKVVTAITALESGEPLDEEITVPAAACGVEGSSLYLEVGEKLTLRQLLYGLMLRSGNDAATAIAIHVGGSVEGFAQLMNEKARMLEAYDSHFTNPHGLHDKNHYTTAYDLAVISSYAMKHPVFREIVGTQRVTLPWTTREYNREVHNKNKILWQYEGGTGIKTGYTSQAGRCLVSSARRGDMELIGVVLNCGPMFEVSMQTFDRLFEKYRMQEVAVPYTVFDSVQVLNRKDKAVKTYCREGFSYPMCEGESAQIVRHVTLPEGVSAPLKKDTEIGKVNYYYDNKLIFSAKLYNMEGVEKMGMVEAMLEICENM